MAEKSDISLLSLAYFRASIGINIAIEFIENCEKAEKETIRNMTFIKGVKTIDHILLNADRTLDNTNILRDITHKRKYYAIDWGLSLSRAEVYRDVKKGDISTREIWYYHQNDMKLPEYIFKDIEGYIGLDIEYVEDKITEILVGMPKEWETHNCIEVISRIISTRIHNILIL